MVQTRGNMRRNCFSLMAFIVCLAACTPTRSEPQTQASTTGDKPNSGPTPTGPFTGKGPNYPPRPPNTLVIETRVLTLDQAQQQASFHLFEPTYLPSGFQLVSVVRSDTPAAIPPTTRFNIEYKGPVPADRTSPSFVSITEEYWPPQPPPPGGIPAPPPYFTPPPKVTVHGVSVYVDKNLFGPSWFTPEPPDERYLALYWVESDVRISLGGSLSLDELIRIADSMK